MTPRDIGGDASQRRRLLLLVGASLAVLVVAVVLVAVYDVGGLRTRAVDNVSEAYGDVVFRTMHDHCIKSANDSVRESGGDPNAPDIAAQVASYCECLAAEMRAEFKVTEIAELEKDDPGQIASNAKVKAIIDRCLAR